MAKTVIILGAGASAADGAPLLADLIGNFFQSKSIQNRLGPHIKFDFQRVFKRIWGIDIQEDTQGVLFPTFEEVLSILDIGESREESFRGLFDDTPLMAMQAMRSHLIFLIALILEEKLRGYTNHHNSLIKNLEADRCLQCSSFISLNYDILIDNAIGYNSLYQGWYSLPDYGVLFTPEPNDDGTPLPKSVLLLKLHGSLNWLYCPTCGTLSLFPHSKIVSKMPGSSSRFICQQCHSPKQPVIVPPTFFKVLSNFHLQQIWRRAEEELKQAERVIFCGYSFPDADIHFKYILKRAEVNRSGNSPEVFIVNEHKGKDNQLRKTEQERYVRFFKDKNKVHWTNLSFEEFASEPESIENPKTWWRGILCDY